MHEEVHEGKEVVDDQHNGFLHAKRGRATQGECILVGGRGSGGVGKLDKQGSSGPVEMPLGPLDHLLAMPLEVDIGFVGNHCRMCPTVLGT